MKKLLSLVLAFALTFSLSACSSSETEETSSTTETTSQTTEASSEETTVPTIELGTTRVAALKGPTAMGLVEFMDKSDKGTAGYENFTFDIIVDPAEVTTLLAKGEIDIAAIPANLASVVYNNTDGAVKTIGINTLGVLYIVENGESVTSIEDLKGKTIYATGKGATPEYSLRYILSENGIDPDTDVTIEWKSEAAEVLSAISASENAIAMLPQPFVSTATSQNENLRVALDLTSEWDAVEADKENPSSLVTGVFVVRTEFFEENIDEVSAFLANYYTSQELVNTNLDEGAKLVGQYEIVPEAIAKIAIPECNITFIGGDDLQPTLSGYLNVLFEANPASIGGAMPADDFYLSVPSAK